MDQLELLQRLISIPSVFPKENELSLFIEELLKGWGYQIERVVTQGRVSLIATLGVGDRYLGFYGHLDTVPPAKEYTRDPFAMVVEDGIARGLGVCDMKGGLSCILMLGQFAAERKLPVKLVFGVDEEDISRGAHSLVDSGLLDPIEMLVVAESGQIEDYSQPVSVVYGRKGRCVLKCEVRGIKAHAAESAKGRNAIEDAAKLIRLVGEVTLEAHPRLGKTQFIVQEIVASADSFSVPNRCALTYSVLSAPGMTIDKSINLIQDLARSEGIDVSVSPVERETPYGEAYELPLSHPLVSRMLEEIISTMRVTPLYTGSVADENVFAHRLKIPVLTVGPIGGGDHTADEWLRTDSLERVVDVYRRILSTYHSEKPD